MVRSIVAFVAVLAIVGMSPVHARQMEYTVSTDSPEDLPFGVVLEASEFRDQFHLSFWTPIREGRGPHDAQVSIADNDMRRFWARLARTEQDSLYIWHAIVERSALAQTTVDLMVIAPGKPLPAVSRWHFPLGEILERLCQPQPVAEGQSEATECCVEFGPAAECDAYWNHVGRHRD